MERKLMVEVTKEELKRIENFGKETPDDLAELLLNYMKRPNFTNKKDNFDPITCRESMIKTFEGENYRVDITLDSSNELNVRIIKKKNYV